MKFDETKAKELFDEGLDDVSIAEQLGVSKTAFVMWRLKNDMRRPKGGARAKPEVAPTDEGVPEPGAMEEPMAAPPFEVDPESEYGKFIKDRGWKYKTDDELKAAYDRMWKAKHGILLAKQEFTTEAEKQDDNAAEELYDLLASMVRCEILTPGDVYQYARFRWCLNDPGAVAAYQTGPKKWEVNNCETEIAEAAARVRVCEEWGFEASRVRIIGTPYYDATDWQFIRFNCAHMCWLWKNGSIYQVFE